MLIIRFKYYSLFLLLPLIGGYACSKSEVPPPFSGQPVFEALVNNDGDSLMHHVAGLKDIYLFTDVFRGNEQVLVMSGTFAPSSCGEKPCPNSLRFEFRNDNQEASAFPSELFFVDKSWEYKTPAIDPPYFGTVRIQVVLSNGDLLRSDWVEQDSLNSFFLIEDSEPWELNEKGQKTWKMKASFNCCVSDSSFQKKILLDGNAILAVGYQ